MKWNHDKCQVSWSPAWEIYGVSTKYFVKCMKVTYPVFPLEKAKLNHWTCDFIWEQIDPVSKILYFVQSTSWQIKSRNAAIQKVIQHLQKPLELIAGLYFVNTEDCWCMNASTPVFLLRPPSQNCILFLTTEQLS
jgi:hypothetical protein